jgi:rubrerythrin
MAFFRSLIIKILLEHAIAAEEHAYGLYEGLLNSSPPPEAARVLKLLAAAELEHRIKLHELQENPDTAAEALRAEGGEAEGAPSSSGPTVPETADFGTAPADFRHLLMTAIEKERRAVRRYKKLADRSRLRAAREVFSYLMRQEQEHEEWISGLLRGLE